MGRFQGLDPARVRELAGHLDTVAGEMAPMHRQLTQILQAAAGDVAPQQVSTSPELAPVLTSVQLPGDPPLPLPSTSSVTDFPVELFPSSMSADALAAGPMPGSIDPFLRRTAADIRSRCDRLDQVAGAAPLGAQLDGAALLDAGLVDLNATPKRDAGEGAVAKWWAGLTPAQREQYLYLKPEVLETLKGLPPEILQQAQHLAYYKVMPYKTSSQESSGGVKLQLGIFELGQGFAFRTEQMNDGTYRVTMINNGQAGVKVEEGDLTLSAGVKLEIGDTWVFKSKADADRLQDDIHQVFLLRQQELGPADGNPMGVATMEIDKILKRIGQPQIKMGTLGTEATLELGGGNVTPSVKFAGNVSTVTSTVDPRRPSVTESRDFSVDLSAVRGQGLKAEAGTVLNGTIQVVRDKNNPDPNTNITAVRLIRTVEGKLNGQFGGELTGKVAEVSGSYKTGVTGAQVVTVNVPIGAAPDEQAAARKWLQAPPTSALINPGVPSGPPAPDADAFAELAHSRGQVSAVTYQGNASEIKAGAKVTIEGIPFGFEGKVGNKEDHVVSQQYLGAPDPETGERRFVPIK
ncbi:hypothetical protein ITI46_32145 [Streptomyces oryzae]|uniref:Uncharacterized protein n=1 Tax=Streptomyces oryzae TaxID=1434886 RepID=A0ABS3XLH0_9ACTN|nr:hypothetical protein [Streptomyces oryzae]MBO8196258.1 hypothetical protein [Streptomyces oryzae]